MKNRVIGGNEGERRRNDFIVVVPAEPCLEDVQGKVKSGRARVQEVRMGELRVVRPCLLELHRLEAETGPTLFQALADLLQAFIDSVTRDEQLDRHASLSSPPNRQARSLATACRPSPAKPPTVRFSLSAGTD